jgi:hypothetical protein
MDACVASNGVRGRVKDADSPNSARGDARWCFRADATCGQQSRRGLGDTDGFAFVPHTVAVFSYGIRWAAGLEDLPKTESQRDSEPDRRIIFAESGRL